MKIVRLRPGRDKATRRHHPGIGRESAEHVAFIAWSPSAERPCNRSHRVSNAKDTSGRFASRARVAAFVSVARESSPARAKSNHRFAAAATSSGRPASNEAAHARSRAKSSAAPAHAGAKRRSANAKNRNFGSRRRRVARASGTSPPPE